MKARGHLPVLAQDAWGGDAVGGMISLDVSLEVMPPLELTTTAKESEQYSRRMINRDLPRRLFALEASAEMVLHQMRDGTIAAVVATDRPPAVAEATEPATILLFPTIVLAEERGEGLLGGLLVVCSSGDGDGVDGRIESGVVQWIERGSKPGDVDSEVISLGVRS